MKPICLRHQSTDRCSPCRPLLPFCLGRGMAPLFKGQSGYCQVWVFPASHHHPSFLFRHPKPGLSSCRFHPSVPPVPVPVRSRPSHLCSAFPRRCGRRWVAIPEPARRERLISFKVWQLCASDRAKGRAERLLRLRGVLRCPRRALPPPPRGLLPRNSPPARVLGPKKAA